MTTRRLVLIHQHQPPNPHTTKKGAQQATQPQAASTHQYLTHHTRSKPCPTTVSVVHSDGETPGPIPNPEAKPARADGTAPGRVWESRLPPTQQLQTPTRSNPHPGAAPRFFVSTPTPNATPTIQRPHTPHHEQTRAHQPTRGPQATRDSTHPRSCDRRVEH